MPSPLPSDLITPAKAARLAGRHVSAVYRWLQSGRLKGYRLAGQRIMIRESDLAKVLEPIEPAFLPNKRA